MPKNAATEAEARIGRQAISLEQLRIRIDETRADVFNRRVGEGAVRELEREYEKGVVSLRESIAAHLAAGQEASS